MRYYGRVEGVQIVYVVDVFNLIKVVVRCLAKQLRMIYELRYCAFDVVENYEQRGERN